MVIDRADGRLVINALFQRIDTTLNKVMRGRWVCRRAIPRIDGSLYFELVCEDRVFQLCWLGPDMKSDGSRQLLEFSGDRPVGKGSRKVVRTVDRALAEILLRDDFFLLRFHNRELHSLRFDDQVVDVLLAGRLEPGRTSWFDYRFVDAFQETNEAFYITFHGPRGPVIFRICSAAAPEMVEGEKLFSNRLFFLTLADDRRDPESRRLVSHQVERFLGFLLNRAVHDEMILERGPDEVVSLFGAEVMGDYETGPVSTSRWGNPRQWYQFFSDFEIERSNLCSFNFADPISWITHGEPECTNIEPHLLCRTAFYANIPWHNEPGRMMDGSMDLFTMLDEEDVIRGGMGKLEGALREAVSNQTSRMVCVNDTCLPKIIGDDVRSAIAKFRQSSSVPILYLNTDLGSPNAAFSNLVDQARKQFETARETPPRAGLNLVGFRPGRDLDEIIRDLEESSIPVNMCFLPELGTETLRKYLLGKTGIVYPHGLWLEIAEKYLADLGVPWNVLPAPYGPRRTREWLQAAADAMYVPEASRSWESRWLDGAGKLWTSLSAKAREHGLAIVVEQGSLQRLVDSSQHYGVEMLPLLEEMGFRLHVLVKQRSTDEPLDLQVLTPALVEPGRHTFTGFSTPDELSELLRRDSFSAVYSEVFFDTRISRSGKAQFNLSMIEMGFDGALRSLRRLLHICNWPFYRRYRRYLESLKGKSSG